MLKASNAIPDSVSTSSLLNIKHENLFTPKATNVTFIDTSSNTKHQAKTLWDTTYCVPHETTWGTRPLFPPNSAHLSYAETILLNAVYD